jgi:hypothetical protein
MYIHKYSIDDHVIYMVSKKPSRLGSNLTLNPESWKGVSFGSTAGNAAKFLGQLKFTKDLAEAPEKEPEEETEKSKAKKKALVEQLDKIASEIQEEAPLIALAIDSVSDQLEGREGMAMGPENVMKRKEDYTKKLEDMDNFCWNLWKKEKNAVISFIEKKIDEALAKEGGNPITDGMIYMKDSPIWKQIESTASKKMSDDLGERVNAGFQVQQAFPRAYEEFVKRELEKKYLDAGWVKAEITGKSSEVLWSLKK